MPEMTDEGWNRDAKKPEEEVHMLRYAQSEAVVPAGTVQDEHDLFRGTGTHLAGEGRKHHLKEGDVDRRGRMKDGAPGGGCTKPTR
jgi:hypothetical protein